MREPAAAAARLPNRPGPSSYAGPAVNAATLGAMLGAILTLNQAECTLFLQRLAQETFDREVN